MTYIVSKFEKNIKIKFKSKNLIIKALTHKSANQKMNNEKLEFLGDRVIGLVISKKLLEIYPEEKILSKISELVEKIKYTQNKYIWMKAALGIMTTDTQPKMAMEECYIGNSLIKIFGIA